ncbi:MAG: UDP-3-O-[3-hydroxymyristoyl] N-acetylglucosamine deacetylase [Planctomycetaceae bacterium]|nr:UDP-3-O-[3-hydroxymyristoyl] N-acetylglucosamine deacetylase [Planctomycetaceae bacterium]
MQQTLAAPAVVHGFGYYSGLDVRVEFRPAAVDAGITFVRTDLGPSARIPVRSDLRVDVPRRTNLRLRGAEVAMVEHVLAALAGLHIDNCEVHVDQAEMPGCDGSALAFVEAIQAAGIKSQDAPARTLAVTRAVRIEHGNCWIEAAPDPSGALRIEYRLDYQHDAVLGRQTASTVVTPDSFSRELAPCRTFLLASEADQLRAAGLGQRVTSRDVLVFGEQGVIDNELRFANECARHKALDVLGDLALTGCRVSGHIVAYRSGHRLNAALAVRLLQQAGAGVALSA